MHIIRMIAAPVIGAAIGYVTNYLAVKMMFRPFEEKRIFGIRLPMTPGIIPRRHHDIARAIGQMVGETLLGPEEIKKRLLQEDTKQAIFDGLHMPEEVKGQTISETLGKIAGSEEYEREKDVLLTYLTDRVYHRLMAMDLSAAVAEKGQKLIRERYGMLAMFISDEMIDGMASTANEEIHDYLFLYGKEKIRAILEEEIGEIEGKKTGKITRLVAEDRIKEKIVDYYQEYVENHNLKITAKMNISAIVEEKIKEMSLPELEKLLLTLMKKELGYLIDLGAVIGFALGLINLLFL